MFCAGRKQNPLSDCYRGKRHFPKKNSPVWLMRITPSFPYIVIGHQYYETFASEVSHKGEYIVVWLTATNRDKMNLGIESYFIFCNFYLFIPQLNLPERPCVFSLRQLSRKHLPPATAQLLIWYSATRVSIYNSCLLFTMPQHHTMSK